MTAAKIKVVSRSQPEVTFLIDTPEEGSNWNFLVTLREDGHAYIRFSNATNGISVDNFDEFVDAMLKLRNIWKQEF